jgi:Uri superfamily endonuclease
MTNEVGTYALLLWAEDERTIEVGALGEMVVRPGWYVYVGSAFGPGGLWARVRRHARGDGALHWHVDYLRAVTTLASVWYTDDATRRECTWAGVLRGHAAARVPMTGFGASDCDCPAHLTAFPDAPAFDAFCQRLRAACPDHGTVARVSPEALRA